MNKRNVAGFSLVELLIVVALSLVMFGFALSWAAAEQQKERRDQLVATQALEMATLTRAVDQYMEGGTGMPSDSEPFTISLADLVAAGLMPSDFATRSATGLPPPVSPFGQAYEVRAIKSGLKYKAAVLTVGAPAAGILSRAGIQPREDALIEVNALIVRRLRNEHFVATGLLRTGSTAIDLLASGFNLDLTAYLSAVPVAPSAVSLAGFPEHSAAQDLKVKVEVEQPEAGGSSLEISSVSFVAPVSAQVTLSECSEGVLPTRANPCIPDTTQRIDVIVVGGGGGQTLDGNTNKVYGPGAGSGYVAGKTIQYSGQPISYSIGKGATNTVSSGDPLLSGQVTTISVSGVNIASARGGTLVGGFSGGGGEVQINAGAWRLSPGGGGAGLYGAPSDQGGDSMYDPVRGRGGRDGSDGETGIHYTRTVNGSTVTFTVHNTPAGGRGAGDVMSRLGFRPVVVDPAQVPFVTDYAGRAIIGCSSGFGAGAGAWTNNVQCPSLNGGVLMRFCSGKTPC